MRYLANDYHCDLYSPECMEGGLLTRSHSSALTSVNIGGSIRYVAVVCSRRCSNDFTEASSIYPATLWSLTMAARSERVP